MHCVIGSGPTGVACAKALHARGANVLMLDAGLELEPERAEILRRLAAVKPSAWAAADVAALKGDLDVSAKGIPLKLLFGSDFPFRKRRKMFPGKITAPGLRPRSRWAV